MAWILFHIPIWPRFSPTECMGCCWTGWLWRLWSGGAAHTHMWCPGPSRLPICLHTWVLPGRFSANQTTSPAPLDHNKLCAVGSLGRCRRRPSVTSLTGGSDCGECLVLTHITIRALCCLWEHPTHSTRRAGELLLTVYNQLLLGITCPYVYVSVRPSVCLSAAACGWWWSWSWCWYSSSGF